MHSPKETVLNENHREELAFLERVLVDPKKTKLLQAYAEEAVVEESVSFLIAALKFKAFVKQTANSIFHNFINPKGITPINLTHDVIHQIKDLIESEDFHEDMFDDALSQIVRLFQPHVVQYERWEAKLSAEQHTEITNERNDTTGMPDSRFFAQ